MSGICGLVALDGRHPTIQQIGTMVAPLEQRGPDGSHNWAKGSAGLGHALLATAPEALSEVLPLTDQETGCSITADVRLDNRDELLAALGLAGEDRVIGDGELILRSYVRWGEECVDHLLGDFAFAVWDPRLQQLFGARDHMGLRPFVYSFAPGKLFAFASEPSSILATGDVPPTINEGRIADYLDNLEGLGHSSTFYREISRLAPAHCLKVGPEGLAIRRYWELRPEPELQLPDDEAYAKAFLEIFTEAVRCRLRSPSPIGAMLSGGMDSGSAARIAATLLAAEGRGPLKTFSAIGPDRQSCAETRTIMLSAAMPGLDPTFIDHSRLDGFSDDLVRLTNEEAEPFDGNMVLIRAVYLAARRANVKVMLDGASGDVVLYTSNYVAELLRRGRFRQAFHEAAGQRRFSGPIKPVWKNLLQSAWVAFVPLAVRRLRRHASANTWHRDICAGIDIDPVLAARTRLNERRKKFRDQLPITTADDPELRPRALRHPHAVVGRERYVRVAAQLAIEPRDPFADIRVIRFALSLPPQQLQAGGFEKLILRRAMKGLLPENVIWRRGKEHLGGGFIRALFDHWPAWREDLRDGIDGIAHVRPSGRSGHRNQNGMKALDFHARITLFYLLCWLRRNR